MASKKATTTKTGAAKKSTRKGGKTAGRKGTAPKVARAKKSTAKSRSAAGRKAAQARWGSTGDTTGPE